MALNLVLLFIISLYSTSTTLQFQDGFDFSILDSYWILNGNGIYYNHFGFQGVFFVGVFYLREPDKVVWLDVRIIQRF